jgi:hypothetical protein
MKFALMEPAALSTSGRDTLVFQCVCSFPYKQPMHVNPASRASEREAQV